jgi:hypothetical protein
MILIILFRHASKRERGGSLFKRLIYGGKLPWQNKKRGFRPTHETPLSSMMSLKELSYYAVIMVNVNYLKCEYPIKYPQFFDWLLMRFRLLSQQ